MSMGTTGTVNVTVKMITDIEEAVSDYRTKTDSLKERLDSEVTGLVGVDFVGSAATGFSDFYKNKIQPVNGEGLTNLLSAIEQIADTIKTSIPGSEGIDQKLADGNNQ